MWIRSQDKTVLVKVFDFRVDCCIGLDGENYIQGNLDSNYDSYILGTYKSKERAIEVLDEIQAYLENNYLSINDMPQHNNGLIANGLILFPNNKQTVYQMPKE